MGHRWATDGPWVGHRWATQQKSVCGRPLKKRGFAFVFVSRIGHFALIPLFHNVFVNSGC